MKRLICVFLVMVMSFSIYACDRNEEASTSLDDEQIALYFGDLADKNIKHLGYEMNTGGQTYKDEGLQGSTIDNLFGYKVEPMQYSMNQIGSGAYCECIVYRNSNGCTVRVNKNTGEITNMRIKSPLEGYRNYETPIDIDVAKERAIEFWEQFYGNRSIDEYVLSYCDRNNDEYVFKWIKFVNGVDVVRFTVNTDLCGNVVYILVANRDEYETEMPNYNYEQIINACVSKLKKAYIDSEIQAEISNVRLVPEHNIMSVYLSNGNVYAMQIPIVYEVQYPDGSIDDNCQAILYLPYAAVE